MQQNNILKSKKGEFGLVAVLALLFGAVIFVSAQVLNSSINNTLNDALLNVSPVNNFIIENTTSVNETTNLTIPIENETQNQTIISNDTINLTLSVDNFSTIETDNLIPNISISNRTIIPNQSINLSDETLNLLNNTILNYSAIVVENLTINLSNNTTRLAKVFDEDSLDFDREYRLNYLQKNKNFSDVVFTNITGNTKYTLKVGAVNERLKGVKLNNQNYVIDILYCEINGKYCAFRINGVPIPQIRSFEQFGNSKVTSFDIDGDYVLKVNSVKFNHCEGTGFCHFGYQSYDVVDVSVERK